MANLQDGSDIFERIQCRSKGLLQPAFRHLQLIRISPGRNGRREAFDFERVRKL
jgi:hypothetical protein